MAAVALMGIMGTTTVGWHGVQHVLTTSGGMAGVGGLGDGSYGGYDDSGGSRGGGGSGGAAAAAARASSVAASQREKRAAKKSAAYLGALRREDVLAEATNAVSNNDAALTSDDDALTNAAANDAAAANNAAAATSASACVTNCAYDAAPYAADPLFREFRVQPPPVLSSADDYASSFLIVSETNYAFTGLACNWLRSVARWGPCTR
jgi:hypothetical protein